MRNPFSKAKKQQQQSTSPSNETLSVEPSLKCPKCSHTLDPTSGSTDIFTATNRSSSSQICFLADYSPIPLLLISPSSVVEAANKAALRLFSDLVIEYGGLNKVHIGELGIEFPDKRWITLAMYLERRRATSLSQGMSPMNRPVEGTLTNSETLEVHLRRPKSVINIEDPRFGPGAPQTRASVDLDSRDYVLIPATLLVSFVNNPNSELHAVISIVIREAPVAASKPLTARSPEADPTSPLLSPEPSRAEIIIDDLASQSDKLRDRALEHLDSHFIAFNVRGDLAVSNKVTREFFGFDDSGIRPGQAPSEWVPRLSIYDPSFKSSTPFSEWYLHNFRKQTVGFKKSIGVYVKDIPRLLEISGEPLWGDQPPWPENLDRQLIGFLTVFRDITRKKELETLQDRDEKLRGIFTSGAVSELRAPIAGIVALLQLLNESHLEAEQTTHLMGLLRSVNYLLIAIDDIIDFSRIEMQSDAGAKPKSFNLYHLLNHVSNLAFHTFSKKEVQYTADIEGLKSITMYKTKTTMYDPGEHHSLDAHMECIVSGDEWKMGRVLANVLSNAFKYTSLGYVNLRVHVLYEKEGICNISFEVKDTGIGISEDAGKTLFKPFVVDSVSDRKPTDSLGLYVTQKLVKQMNGKIEFFSTLGIGTVFKITIPFRKDSKVLMDESNHRSTEDLLQATSKILQQDFTERRRNSNPLSLQLPLNSAEEEEGSLERVTTFERQPTFEAKSSDPVPDSGDSHSFASTSNMTAPAPPISTSSSGLRHPSSIARNSDQSILKSVGSTRLPKGNMERVAMASKLHGTKVMVVEDNWALQNITKLRLEKLGCLPIIAVNGLEALRMLSTRKADPDVILMDLQMPLMNGYEATTTIRNTEDPVLKTFRDIPIVAFTASSAEEDREKAFSCGMSDYLSKPVGMAALSELLHRLTSKSRPPRLPPRCEVLTEDKDVVES